jgi:FSR family fosmidomycin resistance protein-like MFS transporter
MSKPVGKPEPTVLAVIGAVGVCHLLNDMMQSLLPAIYPNLKEEFSLNFSQVGLVTMTYQVTASLLQPLVGLYADRHPTPRALPAGALFSMAGLLILSAATRYGVLLLGAALLGIGSSVFHPESSRVARLASGGRHGFAQSMFQVGGNIGQALGPLAAALVVVKWGQSSLAFFASLALVSVAILWRVSNWYRRHLDLVRKARGHIPVSHLPRGIAVRGILVLLLLVFSKYVYLTSITSYYTFYLIDRFHVSVPKAQLYLFAFTAAIAIGTAIGGPIGDRIGRRRVIWASVLGPLPFTLLLPFVGLSATVALSVIIGLLLASAFPAIVVYAQEIVPGKVGTISGLFFGFAFGVGGLGAAGLGWLADATSVEFVYRVCSFMPIIGLLTAALPDVEKTQQQFRSQAEPNDAPVTSDS